MHSTETALLRVQNDLLQAVDKHGGAILVLLDLSAAFDTIDHKKLLNILDVSFGIRGDALKWFESYLTERTQTVQIGKEFSNSQTLKFGVPQGSVLGPILFTIYTTPLGDIIRQHGIDFHLYADDTQLYLCFKPSNSTSKQEAIQRIENCVRDIKSWMTNNFLKLNEDKTELVVVTSHDDISRSQQITMNIGGHDIGPSEHFPKNLGVVFDSTCSLKEHVTKVCKSVNYHLYSIGKIRKFMDMSTTEKMINALVTSRLDYCNSLMYGICDARINQLQRCQNNAARVISLRRKYDHISDIRQSLHWLPVRQRIDFKVLLLVYKAKHHESTLAPVYLKDLMQPYAPKRSLRSQDAGFLQVPRYNLERFGKRSFAVAGPTLWNDLPDYIRCKQFKTVDDFKSKLKSHLFVKAYS